MIIEPTDPIHFHLSRIKSLQKDRSSTTKSETLNKIKESIYPNNEDIIIDDDNNDTNNNNNNNNQEIEDTGLYQMVGGVLVLPVNKLNTNSNTSTSTSSKTSSEQSQTQTQTKWKPVSLPSQSSNSSTLKSSSQPKSNSNLPSQGGNSKKNTKKVNNNSSNNELVESGPLHITKEDFVFRIKSTLVSYHALILPTGNFE